MRLRASLLLTAFLLTPAWAQDAPAPAQDWSACLPLQVDPQTIYEQLETYGEVFGKPALEWAKSDYDQLAALVTACDGVGFEDGTIVSARDWMEMIGDALKEVYTTAAIHQQVMKWAEDLDVEEISLPECKVLTTYVPPGKDLKDNSRDIFGVPLYGMSTTDLQSAIDHMNNCMAFLPDNSLEIFGISNNTINSTVLPMMDRALLIQIRNNEFGSTAWPTRSETDMSVEFDGYHVAPTLLTDEGKALVRRYNRAASRTRGMTLDAVYNLMAFSSQLLDGNPPDIDRAYGEAIQEKLSSHIFRTDRDMEQKDNAFTTSP